MKTFGIAVLVILLIGATLFFGVVGTVFSTLNRDADLRSRIEAHQRDQESSLSTTRNIINQKSQLPAAAKADLVALLPEIISGRTGGNLFKSVSEKYPEMTLSLYQDLSRSIEAERHNFLNTQRELFSVKQEHDALLRRPLSGLICGIFGRKPVTVTVVSSSEAKKIVEDGREDDLKLNLQQEK